MVKVTMRVGFTVGGTKMEIQKQGFGMSRKAAKSNGYRRAMTAIKHLVAPERYKVLYAVPAEEDSSNG